MRLAEALQIIGQPSKNQQRSIHLLCGFTPLHLETFIQAHLAARFPTHNVRINTGLYGDLEGNIQRARKESGDGAIAVIEWGDFDPRLGFRASGGWRVQTLTDIVAQVEEKCGRIEAHLIKLAEAMPLAIVAPTLELAPLTHVSPAQTGALELELNVILNRFLQRACAQGRIRLASRGALGLSSPNAARHDIKMELRTGFPYTLTHANAVAELGVTCLFPASPKKGLITDLDQTLWKGILGDDGVDGISWSLDEKSQEHALYQQTLASLADSGVLVGIASKNDPQLVNAALQRRDMLLDPGLIFPIEVNWGAKSDAVGRILKAWNVGAESAVFVDDSAMELAEVSEKYPGIECLRFPSCDPAAVVGLLWTLRTRFGKNELLDEDLLRIKSLRSAAALSYESANRAPLDFLSRLEAKVTFEAAGDDQRAYELVNKTNQFNLNGARYTESEWQALSQRPGSFLATVSYEDRFGPLGRIAVLGGCRAGAICSLDIWVMSCRAFSRQIEFQSICKLFYKTGASGIRFEFKATDRNGPLQTFLAHFFDSASVGRGELVLRANDFARLCPPLFHQVNDQWTM